MTGYLLLVFLDSNVVISASRSPASQFHGFWALSHVQLLTSPHSIGEIRRNYQSTDQAHMAEALIASMRVVSDRPDLRLPEGVDLPEKDAPIYLAAWGGGAEFLITGDKKHFGAYCGQNRSGMTVMEPVPFLRLQAK
jgi:hypothetical protein